jgi:hypothetical protein
MQPEEMMPPEPPVEASMDEADEIDEIAEQLAVAEIISEERHAEILGELESCRNQLVSLSQTERAENPLLAQIAESLNNLRAEVDSLKSLTDSRLKLRTPKPSEIEIPAEPSQEPSTVEVPAEVAPVVPATPKKKHRFV